MHIMEVLELAGPDLLEDMVRTACSQQAKHGEVNHMLQSSLPFPLNSYGSEAFVDEDLESLIH